MALTAPTQDTSLLLTTESASNVVEGSLAVLGTQRAEGGYTVYRIVFKVWAQNPDGIAVYLECEAWKRFSELQQLCRQLEVLHTHSQSSFIFPGLVKTHYFDRFKDSVVEERRKSAELLLRFAVSSPHLVSSKALRHFLAGSRIVRIVPTNLALLPSSSPTPGAPQGEVPPPTSLPPHSSPLPSHPEQGHSLSEPDQNQPSNLRQPQPPTAPSELGGAVQNSSSPGRLQASPTPGTNFSTDYSSTESLDAAAQEHVETLLKIVTPPGHHGDGSSDESSSSEEEGKGGGGKGRGHQMRVNSVQVSEWGLEHTLKLREEEEEGRMSGVIGTGEEEAGEDTLRPSDHVVTPHKPPGGEEEEESDSSSSSSSGGGGLAIAHAIVPGSGTTPGPRSPITLDALPTSPLSPSRTSSSAMTWWADALAETQNMEDIDALVEQLDMKKEDRKEGKGNVTLSGPGAQGELAAGLSREGGGGGGGGVRKDLNGREGDGSSRKALQTLEEGTTAGAWSLPMERGETTGHVAPSGAVLGEKDAHPGPASSDGGRGRSTGGSPAPPFERKLNQRNRSAASSRESLDSVGKRRDESTRSSRSPSPSSQPSGSSPSNKGAYIVQAGRLIRLALQYEEGEEFEEAFDLFKAAVDVLLNGVQTERSRQRRDLVSRKTAEYLQHAETLYQSHLAKHKRSAESAPEAAPPGPAPGSAPRVPATQPHLLHDFKVLGLIGKVILVQSKHNGQTYVFKVLYKSLSAMAAVGKGRPKTTKNRSPVQCPHMVRLLHHYETSNHRIFLLLDHVKGGRMVDLVTAKREQWQRLKAAVLNPPSSSLLLQYTATADGGGRGKEEQREDPSKEEEEDEMERMLSELTMIVPPSSGPITDSLSSREEEEVGRERGSEPGDSLDSLALMKRRLEETMVQPSETSLERGQDIAGRGEGEGAVGVDTLQVASSTSISVQPPTPTTPSQKKALGEERESSPRTGHHLGEGLKPALSEDDLLPSTGEFNDHSNERVSPIKGSPGKGSPCFSPASLQNSPDTSKTADDWVRRLEDSVRQWALQVISALEHLHNNGIVCRDLNPDNVLLDMSGRAVLTYFGKWDFVEPQEKTEPAERLYVAPELRGLEEPTPAADWWSLGAILFEVLTGRTLLSCHPEGIDSHIPLRIPCPLSPEAASLLKQLLQVNPQERLGSGLAGAEELRAHPFFTANPL